MIRAKILNQTRAQLILIDSYTVAGCSAQNIKETTVVTPQLYYADKVMIIIHKSTWSNK